MTSFISSNMSEFVLFRTYSDLEHAQELIQILEEHEVPFSDVEDAYSVDLSFSGSHEHSKVQILLKQSDFIVVDQLQEKLADSTIDLSDTTHYLHKFSTGELYDIIEKKDEWSSYDFSFAKALLIQRGESLDDEKINTIRADREDQLSQPEGTAFKNIRQGYAAALAGGIIGVMIGWFLWKSKKTTPQGNKVYTYTESVRVHGQFIFTIGLTVMIICIVCFFLFL